MSMVGSALAAMNHFSPSRWPVLAVAVAGVVALLLTGTAKIDGTDVTYSVVPGHTAWLMISIPFFVVSAVAIPMSFLIKPATGPKNVSQTTEHWKQRQTAVRLARVLGVAAPLVALECVVRELNALGHLAAFPDGINRTYFWVAYVACLSQVTLFLAILYIRKKRPNFAGVQLTLLCSCFLLAAAYSTMSAAETNDAWATDGIVTAPDEFNEARLQSLQALSEQDALDGIIEEKSSIADELEIQLGNIRTAREEVKRHERLAEKIGDHRRLQAFDHESLWEKKRVDVDRLQTEWQDRVERWFAAFDSQLTTNDIPLLEKQRWQDDLNRVIPQAAEAFDRASDKLVDEGTITVTPMIRTQVRRIRDLRVQILRARDEVERIGKELRSFKAEYDRAEDLEDRLEEIGYSLARQMSRVAWLIEEASSVGTEITLADVSDRGHVLEPGVSVSDLGDEDIDRLLEDSKERSKDWESLAIRSGEALENIDDRLSDLNYESERPLDARSSRDADRDSAREDSEEYLAGSQGRQSSKLNRNDWLVAGFYLLWASSMICWCWQVGRGRLEETPATVANLERIALTTDRTLAA